MTQLKFSVCIPNYNYEHYLGEAVESVLMQDVPLEICFADNQSTDGSVELMRSYNDHRIKIRENTCNVGFARNLDLAGQMATGSHMLMLSSDDRLHPEALPLYSNVLAAIQARCGTADASVLSATAHQIDSRGAFSHTLLPPMHIWQDADVDDELSRIAGAAVWRLDGAKALQMSMSTMTNPVNFLTCCYPKAVYTKLEGYGGARLINPDKWFHWRLLEHVESVYWIDRPLFDYRWHAANQTAQQKQSGALKYLNDEVASVVQVSPSMLKRAGMTREELKRAFYTHDVIKHGLGCVKRREFRKAARVFAFGFSAL